jgi:hypothetical protein
MPGRAKERRPPATNTACTVLRVASTPRSAVLKLRSIATAYKNDRFTSRQAPDQPLPDKERGNNSRLTNDDS